MEKIKFYDLCKRYTFNGLSHGSLSVLAIRERPDGKMDVLYVSKTSVQIPCKPRYFSWTIEMFHDGADPLDLRIIGRRAGAAFDDAGKLIPAKVKIPRKELQAELAKRSLLLPENIKKPVTTKKPSLNNSSYENMSRADLEKLGEQIAVRCGYDGSQILMIFAAALTDANFHTEAAAVEKWIGDNGREISEENV